MGPDPSAAFSPLYVRRGHRADQSMMKLSNNEKDENPVAESPRRASILRRLVVGYSSRPGSFES